MAAYLKSLLAPMGFVAGCIVDRSCSVREFYRPRDFKGKLFIYSFLRACPPNGVYDCDGLRFDLDFQDEIQRGVYYGVYERHELAFLRTYIQPGWTCFDIGANVGFYALNLRHLVGTRGRVVAIEACPQNFARLVRNIRLNDFQENVLARAYAVTRTDQAVTFSTSPDGNSGWGRVGPWAEGKSQFTVPGRSLDSILHEEQIDRVHFLKIDIEGHEFEFLKGAAAALSEHRIERILIEYCGYNLEPRGYCLKDYLDQFAELGYHPAHFHMDKIKQAQRGTYQAGKEILNLLFKASHSH